MAGGYYLKLRDKGAVTEGYRKKEREEKTPITPSQLAREYLGMHRRGLESVKPRMKGMGDRMGKRRQIP